MASFIISLILFENLAIANSKYIKYTYIIMGISILYCLYITIKNEKITITSLFRLPLSNVFLFSFIMYAYGTYGDYPEEYSLKFHIMSVLSIVMIIIIINHNKKNIMDLLFLSNLLTIIYMIIFLFFNNIYFLKTIFITNNVRFGYTAVGNVNSTAISLAFLSLPIFYKAIIEKEYKLYLYSHCDYTEVLFSFGLVGFFIYYFLIGKTLFKYSHIEDNNRKLLSKIYLFNILITNFSAFTCYNNIIGYLSMCIAYILIKDF